MNDVLTTPDASPDSLGSTRLQPRDPVVLLAEGGQQDHRQRVVAALAEAAAQRQAVGAGHHHIEDRNVDSLRAKQPQRLVAVARDCDFKAVAF